ncbi:hypothetical protein JOQ06_015260 [Pogonophryne albipinna]|uniref:Uncharacterized protein n=1 Tax=Pogonophryne albipinna TaxID=1090488 RepID=A0AAD6AML3_9TELE|nr:hypothetical protein JOQ06_015260 [Pogonophryne albipinna]
MNACWAGEPSPPPPGTSPLSSFSRKNKRHKRAHNCNNTMMKRARRTMEVKTLIVVDIVNRTLSNMRTSIEASRHHSL